MTTIAKVSRGYLAQEIFTHTKFIVLTMIHKANPVYFLPHVTQYYDI